MENDDNRRVVIVIGAGPAGLAASIGLAQIPGYSVELIEKRTTFEKRGASFGLAKNGLKALSEICSGESYEVVNQLKEGGVSTPNGGLLLPWWEMRDTLLEGVRKEQSNITIRMGMDICSIEDEKDDSQVTVRFSNSDVVLRGTMLIAADGVHSSVRGLMNLPPSVKTGSTVFRGHINALAPDSKLVELLDRGMVPLGGKTYDGTHIFALNYHPKRPGLVTWVVGTSKPVIYGKTTVRTLLENQVEDAEEWKIIQSLFDESKEEMVTTPSTETRVVDFSDEYFSSLDDDGGWGGSGRLTLIGDAAHAMRPTDGQGGNQAFEDVAVLCRTLRGALTSDGDELVPPSKMDDWQTCSEVLKKFESTRLDRVRRIHDDQRMRYEGRMRGEKVGPWSDEFRDWVLQGV